MKNAPKTILIIVLCAVLVLGGILALVLVPKFTLPHGREYAAQFSAARSDYEASVTYLKTLTKKDPTAAVTVSIPTMGSDNTLYFFRDNGGDRVKTIDVKPEDMAHLEAVASAFAACGFEFKNARVQGENVSFVSADDAYSVQFIAGNEKPTVPEGFKAGKIEDCWYQIVRVEN